MKHLPLTIIIFSIFALACFILAFYSNGKLEESYTPKIEDVEVKTPMINPYDDVCKNFDCVDKAS
jgi:hypothetical protein